MCQEEGLKFCLDTRNNGALPLDPAYAKCLSVWVIRRFTLWSVSLMFDSDIEQILSTLKYLRMLNKLIVAP